MTDTAKRELEDVTLTKAMTKREDMMLRIIGKIEPLIPQIVKQFKQEAQGFDTSIMFAIRPVSVLQEQADIPTSYTISFATCMNMDHCVSPRKKEINCWRRSPATIPSAPTVP